MLTYFQVGNPDIQMEINVPWFNFVDWTISYHLGVDGLSVLLVMLTTLLTPLSIVSTWTSIEDRVKDL
jgi:NADH-quinone oxidoreductase subunit M